MQISQLRFVLPVAVFAVVAVALGVGLTLDPKRVPSPLIDKPVPEFSLPPVTEEGEGLASTDLQGQVTLVNFFASWCVSCQVEHPLLNRLTEEDIVPVYGINWKDEPANALRWIKALGDPYARKGSDVSGRVGIDWGVYGLPESYLIDRHGRIAYKHIGPITERDLDNTILPLIERLRG